jgi:hypothetical protein
VSRSFGNSDNWIPLRTQRLEAGSRNVKAVFPVISTHIRLLSKAFLIMFGNHVHGFANSDILDTDTWRH